MEADLANAIRGRKVVEFSYQNHPRRGEPHAVGWQNDHIVLEMYQTGGTSSTGRVPDWRIFSLSKISGLTITEDTFEPRADFNPRREDERWQRFIERT